MLNKINHLSESSKNVIGLVSLTFVIFITFSILNIFFGPDKNAAKQVEEQKKIQEKQMNLLKLYQEVFLLFIGLIKEKIIL